MTPEAESYLAKACEDLEDARKIMGLPLPKVAARSAYYAAFTLRKRLSSRAQGKSPRRMPVCAWNWRADDATLLTFLAKAYKFKEISDYGVGRAGLITEAEATDAIRAAADFVARITALLRA